MEENRIITVIELAYFLIMKCWESDTRIKHRLDEIELERLPLTKSKRIKFQKTTQKFIWGSNKTAAYGDVSKRKNLKNGLIKICTEDLGFLWDEQNNSFKEESGEIWTTDKLKQIVDGNTLTNSLPSSTTGTVHFHANLDSTTIFEEMKNAKHINILHTFFISNQITKLRNSIKTIKEKHDNWSVKILMLEPNGEAARLRTQTLYNMPDEKFMEVENKIINSYHSLLSLQKELDEEYKGGKNSKPFKFLTYNLLPSINIYRFDRKAYVGFFFINKINIKTSFLEIDWTSNDQLTIDIKNQWKELWKYASERRRNDYFDLEFSCFIKKYLREEKKERILELSLSISRKTREAKLFDSNENEIYFGNLVDLGSNWCSIKFQTLKKINKIVQLIFNSDIDLLLSENSIQIALGMYVVNSTASLHNKYPLFSRKVILENIQNKNPKNKKDNNLTKEKFFRGKHSLELKNNLVNTWLSLEEDLNKKTK